MLIDLVKTANIHTFCLANYLQDSTMATCLTLTGTLVICKQLLTFMSIESELVRTIEVESIIARKHNMWRKQLYTITLIVSEKQLD